MEVAARTHVSSLHTSKQQQRWQQLVLSHQRRREAKIRRAARYPPGQNNDQTFRPKAEASRVVQITMFCTGVLFTTPVHIFLLKNKCVVGTYVTHTTTFSVRMVKATTDDGQGKRGVTPSSTVQAFFNHGGGDGGGGDNGRNQVGCCRYSTYTGDTWFG